MKLPRRKTFWIGGDKWTEEWVLPDNPLLQNCAGITYPDDRLIYYSAEYLEDDHSAVKLMIHERLHAVIGSMDVRWDREVADLEEDIVERLVQGLTATFRGKLKRRGM